MIGAVEDVEHVLAHGGAEIIDRQASLLRLAGADQTGRLLHGIVHGGGNEILHADLHEPQQQKQERADEEGEFDRRSPLLVTPKGRKRAFGSGHRVSLTLER